MYVCKKRVENNKASFHSHIVSQSLCLTHSCFEGTSKQLMPNKQQVYVNNNKNKTLNQPFIPINREHTTQD